MFGNWGSCPYLRVNVLTSPSGRSEKRSMGVMVRHVPGPQPPFSFSPDRDQNEEDTTFIDGVAYCVYIPVSRSNQLCP